LADLRYQSELGQAGIVEAIGELCSAPKRSYKQDYASKDMRIYANGGLEIIDLTNDEEEEVERKPDYTYVAHGIDDANTFDLLNCLHTDDLRDLIKNMKLTCKENRVCLPFHAHKHMAYIARLEASYD
jgi:hypothetical protein